MFTNIRLENWKNFTHLDVPLHQRTYVVGPNASGKSNLLDALRVLRDIAEPQGGLQRAIDSRRGISQIRALAARRHPAVVIEVEVTLEDTKWRYRLELSQSNNRVPQVESEQVVRDGHTLFERPDAADKADASRLTQPHMEQVNSNKAFRPLVEFLTNVRYLHLVPQLIREPDRSVGRKRDPFGGDFLEQVISLTEKRRLSRLRHICDALKIAVPNLEQLELKRDDRGVPHLRGLYKHWRPNAGWQTEEQFSDGTLRLLGLLWVLLDGTSPVLLEEPELSLHSAVIRHLPQIIVRLGRKSKRQVILTTHSGDLLGDQGISGDEVVLLTPLPEGTDAAVASDIAEVRALLESGLSVADVVLPRTAPPDADRLGLFGG